MRISKRVLIVGSGRFGFQMSHALDCNVYLLDGGGEYALIDAGGGIEPERIVANVERAGVDMAAVKYLVLTHAHGDHAAGAYFFQSRYGVEVIAPGEAAPWIEQGDTEKNSLAAAIAAGAYPQNYEFHACPVAKAVEEDEIVAVGDVELRVLETPGHSRGHISLLFDDEGRRALFSGDAIFAGGKIVLQNTWDCSIPEYAATVATFNRLRIDMLFPGHGPFLLSEAYRHVEQAHAAFESLAFPPNL